MAITTSLAVAAADRLLRAALSFTVGIAVIKHLGPTENAILISLLAAVSVASTVSKLGLDQIIMRDLAVPAHAAIYTALRFMLIRLCTSFVGAFILIAYGDKISSGSADSLLVAAALVILLSVDLGALWCNALALLRYSSFFSILLQLASAGGRLALIYSSVGYVGFLVVSFLEMLGSAIVLNVIAIKNCWGKLGEAPTKSVSLTEILNSAITSVVIVAYFAMDALLLPRLLTIEEAGVFLAGKSVIDTATTIGSTFALALFPYLAATKLASAEKFERLISASLCVVSVVGAAMALIVCLLYSFIVAPFLGAKYVGSVPIVYILSFSLVLYLQGGVTDSILTINRRTRVILFKSALALLVKAAVLFFLADKMSMSLYAYISVITAYLATFAALFLTDRRLLFGMIKAVNIFQFPQAIKSVIHIHAEVPSRRN